jgi:DNA-binding beta-propeller fold protein YncE
MLAGVATLALMAGTAQAQLAISANDNKVTLRNGVATAVPNPAPDTISLIDLSGRQPRLRAEIPVPASVVGPPVTVAISPDGKIAVVTANQRPDPADPTKFVNGNSMAVVDLAANPPRVTATLPTGAAPAGLSFSPDGKLLLVAHRGDGTIGVWRVNGAELTETGRVSVGTPASMLSHAAFTPDGRFALVTRYNDASVAVLAVNGEQVTATDRNMTTGVNPYGLAITRDGKYAVVANIGRGSGDADTVSLIDLQRQPFRVVDTMSVGQTPEGIMVSPDNRHVAVTVMNGSNKPENSPFRGPGLVKMLRIENGRLRLVSEAQVGTWSQGAGFSANGRMLLVGNMMERNITVLRVENGRVRDTGQRIAVSGGSAALRVAD